MFGFCLFVDCMFLCETFLWWTLKHRRRQIFLYFSDVWCLTGCYAEFVVWMKIMVGICVDWSGNTEYSGDRRLLLSLCGYSLSLSLSLLSSLSQHVNSSNELSWGDNKHEIRGKVGLGLVIRKLREEKIKECELICIMIQCIKVRQLLHMYRQQQSHRWSTSGSGQSGKWLIICENWQ